MSRPHVIIGGGGHGRVVLDALLTAEAAVLGVCDPALRPGTDTVLGVPVLGGDEYVLDQDPAAVLLVNGIGSVKSLAARAQVYERFRGQGFAFGTVVHPSAVVSAHATLHPGAQVMAGAVVQCGTEVGGNAIINTRAAVDHDCIIAETVHIAPGAVLSGGVRVGNLSHVGTGTAVVQGIVIGDGALIGAGATLRHPVADGARVV